MSYIAEYMKKRYNTDEVFRKKCIKTVQKYQSKSEKYKAYMTKYNKEHSEKRRLFHKEIRRKAKENGICMTCHKAKLEYENVINKKGILTMKMYSTCPPCRERNKAAYKKRCENAEKII